MFALKLLLVEKVVSKLGYESELCRSYVLRRDCWYEIMLVLEKLQWLLKNDLGIIVEGSRYLGTTISLGMSHGLEMCVVWDESMSQAYCIPPNG